MTRKSIPSGEVSHMMHLNFRLEFRLESSAYPFKYGERKNRGRDPHLLFLNNREEYPSNHWNRARENSPLRRRPILRSIRETSSVDGLTRSRFARKRQHRDEHLPLERKRRMKEEEGQAQDNAPQPHRESLIRLPDFLSADRWRTVFRVQGLSS